MQDSILNRLGFDPGFLILGLMVILVFVLIYLASISMKLSRFMKRYKIFMRGKDGVSLERAFESNFIEVDRIAKLALIGLFDGLGGIHRIRIFHLERELQRLFVV